MSQLDWEQQRLQLREQLIRHPLFTKIDQPVKLKKFMQAHVFAVWDFMSLAKRLQRELTCIDLPWLPPRDPGAARLINEIVLGEESDTDGRGSFSSHYELYLAAMQDMGASPTAICSLIQALRAGMPWRDALAACPVPEAVKAFTHRTLTVACEGSTAEVLGAFFYGREEVIPAMFTRLLADWAIEPQSIPRLSYYLQRHIQLDQDQHGPAAEQLLVRLLEQDEASWSAMRQSACRALQARIDLWDGVLDELIKH